MVVHDSAGCSPVPRRLRGIVVVSSGYEYRPSVDMVNYVPLDKRVRGACRCSVCSQNPEIAKWYANDILCKFDSSPCSIVNDSGVRVCSWKHRGSIQHCPRFIVSKVLVAESGAQRREGV